MKKVILSAVIFLIAAFLHSSCSEDINPGQNSDLIESSLEAAEWKITFFQDSGKDETSHFSGYTFIFLDNGKILTGNGNTSFEGTWILSDNSSSDDSPDDPELIIHYELSNEFEDLNEDWHFISSSASKIELTHVSGGNGGTDFLTFESK